jgi:tetratricopeptide (TPR) repeat protein
MLRDAFGLDISTDSTQALAAWDAAVRSFLEFRLDAIDHGKAMLEADPECAMSHCLRGILLTGLQSDFLAGKIGGAVAEAEARAQSATPRERLMIEALRAIHAGDQPRAILVWDRILVDHPHDLFALRLQHNATFWLGRNHAMRDAIARAFPAWDESRPGYGFVLGMYCFALEESGDYARAEPYGRRAVEMNEDDVWSIHAVTHVLEMQGRLREGSQWLSRPPDIWDDRNPMREHLWWHLAMFEIERGRIDEVLDLYDGRLRAKPTDFYLDIQNCASMLWRLECRDVDVGGRWEELADACAGKIEDHALAFTEPHHVMALGRAGRFEDVDRGLESLERCASERSSWAASIARRLTIPLCRAVAAYCRGDCDEATELLLPIRADYPLMGASHAQRDVFAQLLNEAALRGRRFRLARGLLAERVELRPNSADSWSKYADALSGCGEEEVSTRARARSDECRAAA